MFNEHVKISNANVYNNKIDDDDLNKPTTAAARHTWLLRWCWRGGAERTLNRSMFYSRAALVERNSIIFIFVSLAFVFNSVLPRNGVLKVLLALRDSV